MAPASRPVVPSKRPLPDAQEAAWVADEDRFVLQQAKKKAALRVRGGRAEPIDWLAVTLAVIDPVNNALDDEIISEDLDIKEPTHVFDGMSRSGLLDLSKAIDTYITLERSRSNREYWNMMQTICKDRQKDAKDRHNAARGVDSVAADVDRLLGPKSLAELEKLETQIKAKLASNQAIDTDYWEHLLQSLLTYKARAKLKNVSRQVLASRLQRHRQEQVALASESSSKLAAQEAHVSGPGLAGHERQVRLSKALYDPMPQLKLRSSDKSLPVIPDHAFEKNLAEARKRVVDSVFIPAARHESKNLDRASADLHVKRQRLDGEPLQPLTTAFDREVARGLGDNEEIFTDEVEVVTKNRTSWDNQHRPRKPKYFARVQLGYEWNKYNQTHYDQDNPPPKVVQGYKFNVFYPDLVDKNRAPTFKIERNNGRKRGQSATPAGESDSCVIRFIAGAPYEDLAFRIVDKEWDYSAKRERGFRSSFDKGILQLHFQFKKVYYRK